MSFKESILKVYTMNFFPPKKSILSTRKIMLISIFSLLILSSIDNVWGFQPTEYSREIIPWVGEGDDCFNDVKVDTQGNIYAVGYTTSLSLGYSDLLIVKYSPVGELIWEKKWGDANAEYCSFKRVSTLWRHIIRRSFAITTTKR